MSSTAPPLVEHKVVGRSADTLGLSIVSLVVATIFLLLVRQVWITAVDDSFITLRYAQHLAGGYGPTWNIGGPPVEGYTTFLWMIILAIPHLLHIDTFLFAKVIGVICTLTIFVLTFWAVFSSSAHDSRSNRIVPALCAVTFLLAFAPTAVHAVTGMETALFTCLLTGFFVALAGMVNQPSSSKVQLVALLGLLVGLTRPEGNVAVGTSALVAFFLLPRPARWQYVSSLIMLYVVPGLAYMMWRVWYYEALLPLPFLVKAVHQGPFAGFGAVLDFVTYMGLRVGILCVLGAFYLGRSWLPAVVGSLAFAAFWLVPAHIMGYHWRFLYPLVPFIMIVAGNGVIIVARMGERVLRHRGVLFSRVPVLVAVAVTLLVLAVDAPLLLTTPVVEGQGLQAAHIRLGRELAQYKATNTGSNPLLAIGDAGAAPYYSGWRTIDHFGLNDPTIARSGSHDPSYVLDQNPDVVVLISRSQDTFDSPLSYENDLYAAVVARGMMRVNVLTYLPERHHLWVYVMPQSPFAAYYSGISQHSQ